MPLLIGVNSSLDGSMRVVDWPAGGSLSLRPAHWTGGGAAGRAGGSAIGWVICHLLCRSYISIFMLHVTIALFTKPSMYVAAYEVPMRADACSCTKPSFTI